MLRNRIGRTLFKSLLKWNRRPEIVASKFTIDPIALGINDLLPVGVVQLKNAEGVQAAVYHCFRTMDASPENIDAGFKVLKGLNNVGAQVKQQFIQREIRNIPSAQALAQFRIGQVVQHKKKRIRAVVVGWEVDRSKQMQKVEVLEDYADNNEFSKGFRPVITTHYESADLELVTDPQLMRVMNKNLNSYFLGFSSEWNRYIPDDALSFWYSKDIDKMVMASRLGSPAVNVNSNTSTDTGDSVAKTGTDNIHEFVTSLHNVQNTVMSLAKELDHVLVKHTGISALAEEDSSNNTLSGDSATISNIGATEPTTVGGSVDATGVTVELNRSSESAESLTFSQDEFDQYLQENAIKDVRPFIIRQVLEEVISTIRLCAQTEVQSTAASANSQPKWATTSCNDASSTEDEFVFARKLVRGGAARHAVDPRAVHSNDFEFWSGGTRLSQLDQAYHTLGHLSNCFALTDQLLGIRFQHNGLAFSEGLYIDKHGSTSNGGSVSSGDVHTPVLTYDDTADDCVRAWNRQTTLPKPIFYPGQVVRHKQFGYRGVISGLNMRPKVDMSKWEGLVGLKYGQEQPVYTIIPDQGDVEHMLGDGTFRSYYLVPQENIELIERAEEKNVDHSNFDTYFAGYDVKAGKFRVPHKLRYCASTSPESSLPVYNLKSGITEAVDNKDDSAVDVGLASEVETTDGVPATTIPGKITQSMDAVPLHPALVKYENDLQKEQQDAYNTIDIVLVEMNEILRRSFTQTRTAYSGQATATSTSTCLDMSDLLTLLQHAHSREHSVYAESVIWMVWMGHSSVDIRQLMRLSSEHASRGNLATAAEICQHAVDTNEHCHAEVHNKLASYCHAQGNHEGCIASAEKALELFPQHFGAIMGLALSMESMGNKPKARELIREVLRIHPWAVHVPTILVSMSTPEVEKVRIPNAVSANDSISSSTRSIDSDPTSTTITTTSTRPVVHIESFEDMVDAVINDVEAQDSSDIVGELDSDAKRDGDE